MGFKQEAIDFILHLQNLYMEQRDIETLFQYFMPDITWFGTGRQEICNNIEEAKEALTKEFIEYSGHFDIYDCNYSARMLHEHLCLVYGSFFAKAVDGDIPSLRDRLTAIISKTPQGLKLCHLHMSRPDEEQDSGEFYPHVPLRESKRYLLERIKQTDLELESLIDNIPGGVHKCFNDDVFSLLYVSSSFLSLFGYSKEDLKSFFHNHFSEMIFYPDRQNAIDTIRKQLEHGNTIEVEYRVRCKDGKLLWIYDKGKLVTAPDGNDYFYCVMLDYTERKKEQEDLRLSLERHQIIMNQTTDTLFEWDMEKDTLAFSANWTKRFGYPPIQKDISALIPLSSNIHFDDMANFVKIMNNARAGVPYSETEFRIRDNYGCFSWCRIRATVQYNANGNAVKATGVILDIDKEKKLWQQLSEEASRDSLTGLLNKNFSKNQVKSFLKDCSLPGGSLFIIDLDDFKQVNDHYGHLCGDAVLTNVANVLKHQSDPEDVIARIGGDEFMIFSPSLTSPEVKAESLLKELDSISMDTDIPNISCSIGIAQTPKDASDYYSLFNCADHALYYVKTNHKGHYSFYQPHMMDTASEIYQNTAVNSNIDSESDISRKQFLEYSFQMLYHTNDVFYAIHKILEFVGKTYNINRAYIFENSSDGAYCTNTFEWCAPGIPSMKEQMSNLSYKDDLNNYPDYFNDEGIFYCLDIKDMAPPLYKQIDFTQTRSILQCATLDEGIFKGFTGFDECRNAAGWTREQINSLELLSHILSTFLLRYRIKKSIHENDSDK